MVGMRCHDTAKGYNLSKIYIFINTFSLKFYQQKFHNGNENFQIYSPILVIKHVWILNQFHSSM
jgi:hypothetical protein